MEAVEDLESAVHRNYSLCVKRRTTEKIIVSHEEIIGGTRDTAAS